MMHVIEQFTTTILAHHFIRSRTGVNQMPMPMMAINTDILTEVAQTLLLFTVRGGEILRNVNAAL